MKEYTASQPKSDPNEGVQGVEKASLSLPARSANNESLSERPNLIWRNCDWRLDFEILGLGLVNFDLCKMIAFS